MKRINKLKLTAIIHNVVYIVKFMQWEKHTFMIKDKYKTLFILIKMMLFLQTY